MLPVHQQFERSTPNTFEKLGAIAPRGLGCMPRELCWIIWIGLVPRTLFAVEDCPCGWDGTKDCAVQCELGLGLDWSNHRRRLLWRVVEIGLVHMTTLMNWGCSWNWAGTKGLYCVIQSSLLQRTLLANMDYRWDSTDASRMCWRCRLCWDKGLSWQISFVSGTEIVRRNALFC